jgi:hypothetical protein
MNAQVQGFRSRAKSQAEELLQAISAAESAIVTTIERECEALRAGRMLAARALHTRLTDAAALYLNAIKAARASLWTIEQVLPGSRDELEERRIAFAALLKVEFAVLSATREEAGDHSPSLSFDDPPPPQDRSKLRRKPVPLQTARRGAR